jgi:hypothetical protein
VVVGHPFFGGFFAPKGILQSTPNQFYSSVCLPAPINPRKSNQNPFPLKDDSLVFVPPPPSMGGPFNSVATFQIEFPFGPIPKWHVLLNIYPKYFYFSRLFGHIRGLPRIICGQCPVQIETHQNCFCFQVIFAPPILSNMIRLAAVYYSTRTEPILMILITN